MAAKSSLNPWQLHCARRTVLAGGVIAYPTEAVWGLGCDPWNQDAVERILELKQRPMEKGMILVAASVEQVRFLLDPLPRVILVPGLGLFGAGGTARDAAIAADIAESTVETVTDAESFAMTRRVAREEGLFAGGSSGLVVHAALEIAKDAGEDAVIVTLLADWGEHYLTKAYDDDWMRENGFMKRTHHSVHHLVAEKDRDLPELITVQPTTPVRVALSTLTSHNVSQLPVILDGECVGSLHDGELMSSVIEDPELLDRPVESIMDAPFPVLFRMIRIFVASPH